MKRGVIFDLDGTLIDSMPFWNSLGERYLKYIGIVDKDIDKETYNMTIEEAASYMKHKHNLNESVSYIRLQINCLIEEQYFKKLTLNEGVLEYIEYLYAHNYKLIVATDTPKPLAQAVLKKNGVLDYFIDVITTIKVKQDKSRPDIYDYCVLRMGLSKDDVVVIEDDDKAIETLKNASYDVIGFKTDASYYKIDSFKDEIAYKMLEKLI